MYKRVLLKLSGEVLAASREAPFSETLLQQYATDIVTALQQGIEIGVVVGGGNILRGREIKTDLICRRTADHMGMLATVMNGLALRDAILQAGAPACLFSAKSIEGVAKSFDPVAAEEALSAGQVVIFTGGTGNPFVTTDAASSLRGLEIGAEVLLKATNVDGVYSADPKVDTSAILYSTLSFDQALVEQLAVMDVAAFSQCRDYDLPIRVFNIYKSGALLNALLGADEGTLISNA